MCLVAFSVLQRSFFPKHYRYRLTSESVTIKPQALATKGWSSLWCVGKGPTLTLRAPRLSRRGARAHTHTPQQPHAHPTHKTNRQWLIVALRITNNDILRSAGLDALVMVQALAIGVQIFAPMALVGVAVLVPLHYRAAERRGGLVSGSGGSDDLDRSAMMRLTIASLPQGSALAWCVVLCGLADGCCSFAPAPVRR